LFTSLRARLLAVYLGLIIVGIGGLTLLAGRQIADSIYDDFGRNLQIYALLLANQMLEPMEENPAGAAQLIQAAAENLNAQITVFNTSGSLIYNSDGAPVSLVEDAGTGYVFRPNAQGEETIYASAVIRGDDRTVGSVQIGAPAAVPQAAVRQRWLVLVIGFVGFSLFGLAVSLWLLTSLTRPLSRLRDTALIMAEGDLSQRVSGMPQDEIGEVGQAFNVMAERIEAMVAEQRAFSSNASHELRTPLTTIRLRSEWLKAHPPDEPTARQYVEEIDSEARHMSRLVEDLLTLSQLENQGVTAGEEQVDVSRLLEVLEREYIPLAAAKQIALTIQLPAEPLPPVQANLSHLRIAFRNVLDNALKYTPTGGQVTALLAQEGDYVRFQVADNGQGISAEDLPHIGQRFYRADRARSRQTLGTGLGLALVQSIVELYGGQLELTSPGLNRGTTVAIRWPVCSPAVEI